MRRRIHSAGTLNDWNPWNGWAMGLALVGLLGSACAITPRENWPPATGADAAAEAEIDEAGKEPQPAESSEADAAEPEGANQAQVKKPSAMRQRAESAAEGAIIGTVIGGQIAGVYGAAAGAALFGLYGLITGDVPFDAGRPARGPGGPAGSADDAMEREIDDELRRWADAEGVTPILCWSGALMAMDNSPP